MESAYISWLRSRGIALFEAAGHIWRRDHQKVLTPATLGPCYVNITVAEGQSLLRRSGTLLLRYSSDPTDEPTSWWYVICDRYEPQMFSSKIRNKINRGKRDCLIRRVEPEWLAQRGYGCYVAAYKRYRGDRPQLVAEAVWQKRLLGFGSGPAEFWAILVGQDLAGYCLCQIDNNVVSTEVIKVDPAFYKNRPMEGLVNTLGEHYVRDRGHTLTNGNTAVLHDTKIQDFLLDHGYRRQFCRLNLLYNGWLRLAVGAAFPFQRVIEKLPGPRQVSQLVSLLRQEDIRRSCSGP